MTMKLLQMIPIPKIRRRKAQLPSPGAAPGTLAPVADGPAEVVVTRHVYGPDGARAQPVDLDDLEQALEPEPGQVVWVDVCGLGDTALVRRAAAELGLHPLTLEDVVHVHQRSKVEAFDDHLFVVLRAIRLLDDGQVDNEQLSFVLRNGLVVTFQERRGDGFDPVRRRIREGKGALRQSGADYLLYALVDATIDDYFPVLEAYAEAMDQLDEQVRERPSPEVSHAIHAVRRELRQLRRATGPLHDVARRLSRGDFPAIEEPARLAFRDCHDHALQVNDFVDGSRERFSDLADLYRSMVDERTNEVMRMLTIVATMFIPLTFLCGLYGMNFDREVSPYNMPELGWRYGYPAVWGVMIALVAAMLWYFRRKGWLGTRR